MSGAELIPVSLFCNLLLDIPKNIRNEKEAKFIRNRFVQHGQDLQGLNTTTHTTKNALDYYVEDIVGIGNDLVAKQKAKGERCLPRRAVAKLFPAEPRDEIIAAVDLCRAVDKFNVRKYQEARHQKKIEVSSAVVVSAHFTILRK